MGVVLFGTASPSSLFLAFRHEAMAAAAGEVAFREVELEAATHLRLNIIDLSVSQKVRALRVSYNVHTVLVLDDIAVAGLVQLQTELVSRTASCFDENAEGEGRVAHLFQIILDLDRCLFGYTNCHILYLILVQSFLFNPIVTSRLKNVGEFGSA